MPIPTPKVQINRIGAIPKKHQPGKWRIITDLSHQSVNDSIDAHCCSMSYVTVDEIARAALSLGKGSLIAKIDIKAAYRLVPVHPEDRAAVGRQHLGGWNVTLRVEFSAKFF